MNLNNLIGYVTATWNGDIDTQVEFSAALERHAETIKWPGVFTGRPHKPGEPLKHKRPGRIFVQSMGDLFCPAVESEFIQEVIDVTRQARWHIFLFLTQNPARYPEFEFPGNCWLGTTVRNLGELRRAEILCDEIGDKDNLRFLSLEPLEEGLLVTFQRYIDPQLKNSIKWTIIGCRTPYHEDFQLEWAKSIVEQCESAKVPIWIKQLPGKNGKADKDINHWPLWAQRREYPKNV